MRFVASELQWIKLGLEFSKSNVSTRYSNVIEVGRQRSASIQLQKNSLILSCVPSSEPGSRDTKGTQELLGRFAVQWNRYIPTKSLNMELEYTSGEMEQ